MAFLRCGWVLPLLMLVPFKAMAESTPAQFGKYAERFAKMIKLPASPPFETASFQCTGWARGGFLRPVSCDGHRAWEVAVVNDLIHRRIRVVAAEARGRKQTTWMQFTVNVERTEAGDEISLVPNHGHSIAELGEHYVSPQRYESNRATYHRVCPTGYDVRVSGLVKLDGRIADTQVTRSEMPESCNEAILDYLRTSEFIPAHLNGEAVEAVLVDRFMQVTGHARRTDPDRMGSSQQ